MKTLRDRKALILVLFIGLFTATMYLNCGGPSGSTLSNPAAVPATNSSASTTTSAPTTPLSVTVTPLNMILGQTAQISASGGSPPYTYSLLGSNGMISSTGLISGQTALGPLDVVTKDSVGSSAMTSLVVDDAAGNTTGQCTLAGINVVNGGTITGYSSQMVGCGSTCTSQVLSCSNGNLSGQTSFPYASCSATACAWMASATACANPVSTLPPLPCSAGSTVCYTTATTTYNGYTTLATTGAIYTCH